MSSPIADRWSCENDTVGDIMPRTLATSETQRRAERADSCGASSGCSPGFAGRHGVAVPGDLAELALFLAGPGSARMTGQVLSVNGGISVA